MHDTADDIKQSLLAQIDQRIREVNGDNGYAAHKLHAFARASFEKSSFPTRKDEDWKYTSVKPILSQEYTIPGSPLFDTAIPDEFEAISVHFVNGVFKSMDNDILPEGSFAGKLSEALKISVLQDTLNDVTKEICTSHLGVFESMGLGLNDDPMCIIVPDNLHLAKPIHLIYATESNGESIASHPYTLIIIGKNAEAEVVESYLPQGNTDNYYTNTASRIFLGANARLTHYRLQAEGNAAFHTAQSTVMQGRDSTYGVYIAELGGKLMRNNIHIAHEDENITSNIYGLFVAQGSQHIDTQSFIDHAKPHCLSNELIKGVLLDRGRGVFNGKIIVRPDAQKINAYQQNATLVLSPDAVMDSKPQLEIFADDVKCSHGATIGQLDPEALFYLKSRGLNDEAAQALLKNAFLGDVLDHFPNNAIADYFKSHLEQKLASTL